MLIIAGHVLVHADERDRYVADHADLLRRARAADGCLDIALGADPVDPQRVNNLERWESWEAVEAWRAVADAPEAGEVLDAHVEMYDAENPRSPFPGDD